MVLKIMGKIDIGYHMCCNSCGHYGNFSLVYSDDVFHYRAVCNKCSATFIVKFISKPFGGATKPELTKTVFSIDI